VEPYYDVIAFIGFYVVIAAFTFAIDKFKEISNEK